ncbi:MAG: CYTH domain-containing protein [Chlorobi bacterium]|nr:CYTH domain-containing protein [Chlorobiota bacterium]
MAKEIERKFLVLNNDYKKQSEGILYKQGFLNTQKERVVRIRLVGNKGYLTVKGITRNISRCEYEYEIPFDEAEHMLNEICEKPIISKLRYKIPMGNFIWEVDEFLNDNKGLVIAEIELEREDQEFPKPSWLGKEVSGDPKYYNANLVRFPYLKW